MILIKFKGLINSGFKIFIVIFVIKNSHVRQINISYLDS